ncbi:MAG: N-acetyltransferase family protein [Coriobacteriia bacterium]|nr:N-acetyltransferase family protein [Coriobacteriia bacterium]
MHIRPATADDVPAITAIYNQAVTDTTASFDLESKTLDERMTWFVNHGPRHPVFVAEAEGQIAGWGSLSPYSERPAYDATVEISIYIERSWHRRGIGAALGQQLLASAREIGLHVIVARICTENEASLRLTRNLGFEDAGTLHAVGFKFGRWLDVAQLELVL